jgi:hypothetical protein
MEVEVSRAFCAVLSRIHATESELSGCDAMFVLEDADALGLIWLKMHQRESGRWFTASINGSPRNLIPMPEPPCAQWL